MIGLGIRGLKTDGLFSGGRIRPIAWILIIISSVSLAASCFVVLPWLYSIRRFVSALKPDGLVFDAGVLTDIFVLLWGITQALILFYMEHKKEKVLGVSLDRIIQVSMGSRLVVATLVLFLIEMVFWIGAVSFENHYLMLTDLILQIVNVVAVFVVIQLKQEIESVIGTCKWELQDIRRKYKEGIKERKYKDGEETGKVRNYEFEIQKMIFFDMLREENVFTSTLIERMKEIVRCAFDSDDEEDMTRFKYELLITERILERSRNEGTSKMKVNEYEIPKVIKFYFEDQKSKGLFSKKVMLYALVRSRNTYDPDEIINMLNFVEQPPLELYVWCGIWSIYWREYGTLYEREDDILRYKAKAGDASIELESLLIAPNVEGYKIAKAYKEWEEMAVG